MPEMTKYAPGTPCWIDLSTTDLDPAKKFYGAVLGWTDYSVGPEESGFYTMSERDGKSLAGMMTQMPDEKTMGVPPHWNTYVSVTSADDAAKKAKELGAMVVVEPMDVMDVGRMAVFIDPEGAAISVWEPKAHVGAAITNEPGAFTWSELYTKDPTKATAFYTGLFGWSTFVNGPPMNYVEWKLGEKSIGGMMQITPEMGPIPPNWLTYFAVDNTDAAAAAAGKSGGSVMMPAMDIPDVGRFAVLADGQGAVFAILQAAMA